MSFISKHRSSVDDSAVLRVGVPATRSNTIARVVTSPAVNTGDAGRTWSLFNSQTNSPTILPGRKAFAASFIDSDEDIFSAIAAGDLNAVHIAMQSGTDPNVIDAFQEPALHYVIRRQNRRIFSLFITLGVNVNASDLFGRTALHVAVGGKDSLFVDYLLRAGANPVKQDQFGNTPLHLAVRSEAVEAMALLMDADSSIIDMINLEGVTALHLAVKHKSIHSTAFLLKRGAKGKQSLWQHAPSEDFLTRAMHLTDAPGGKYGTLHEGLGREIEDRIQKEADQEQRVEVLEACTRLLGEEVHRLQLQLDACVLVCRITTAACTLSIGVIVYLALIKK